MYSPLSIKLRSVLKVQKEINKALPWPSCSPLAQWGVGLPLWAQWFLLLADPCTQSGSSAATIEEKFEKREGGKYMRKCTNVYWKYMINHCFLNFSFPHVRKYKMGKARTPKRVSLQLHTSPSSSKLTGTLAPLSARALFLATAVSRSAFAQAPACPNWTSEENIPGIKIENGR